MREEFLAQKPRIDGFRMRIGDVVGIQSNRRVNIPAEVVGHIDRGAKDIGTQCGPVWQLRKRARLHDPGSGIVVRHPRRLREISAESSMRSNPCQMPRSLGKNPAIQIHRRRRPPAVAAASPKLDRRIDSCRFIGKQRAGPCEMPTQGAARQRHLAVTTEAALFAGTASTTATQSQSPGGHCQSLDLRARSTPDSSLYFLRKRSRDISEHRSSRRLRRAQLQFVSTNSSAANFASCRRLCQSTWAAPASKNPVSTKQQSTDTETRSSMSQQIKAA